MTVETRLGKITASKEVLNELSLVLLHEAKRFDDRGRCETASRYLKSSNDILEALEANGYYDDVK